MERACKAIGASVWKSQRRSALEVDVKGFLLVLALFVSGCATQQMWYLHGKTETELQATHSYCQSYADQFLNQQAMEQAGYAAGVNSSAAGAALGLMFLQASHIQSVYERCMREHGFTKAE